jgi:asparagine synthase (glutamine-hydrolysing)
VNAGGDLALGHRRLAVIDLSAAGHQPMTSPCERFTLVFNGEIYNHPELRAELERQGGQFDWQGHSDTETLLAGFRHWGFEAMLPKLNGMFAFALWDAVEMVLYLARDRMGEKPLYYGRVGDLFLFGSELKSLKAHPDWGADIDRNALTSFLRYSYVPAPYSIYQNICKLLPAHYVVIRDQGRQISAPRCYWDLREIAEKAAAEGDQAATPDASIAELDRRLRKSILSRMTADVPLGAFLSGGFDSTTVVALMQAQSMQAVKTFTIGFGEKAFNEAIHAQAVARHLGTDHTELYLSPQDALAVIPRLPSIWDEPFADSSQIPTFLVSEMARRHVTVSLSGDGGDELFCGYHRYVLGYRLWNRLRCLPARVRSTISKALMLTPTRQIDQLTALLPKAMQMPLLSDRLPKLAEALNHRHGGLFYQSVVSQCRNPSDIVVGGVEPPTIISDSSCWPQFDDLRNRMMYFDSRSYLPDDILTKVDRASMAVSLEARVPLLDHELVEFSWQLPLSLKYRDGVGKWPLRQLLYRYVPKTLMERPKAGFAVPIEQWLRGPIRDWAESLLQEQRLDGEGFFDPKPVRHMWQEHVAGKRSWHHQLWSVLMFQAWLEVE